MQLADLAGLRRRDRPVEQAILAECSERVITDGQQVAVCAYFDTNSENLYLTVPDRDSNAGPTA
jgi:hypothetical protein